MAELVKNINKAKFDYFYSRKKELTVKKTCSSTATLKI